MDADELPVYDYKQAAERLVSLATAKHEILELVCKNYCELCNLVHVKVDVAGIDWPVDHLDELKRLQDDVVGITQDCMVQSYTSWQHDHDILASIREDLRMLSQRVAEFVQTNNDFKLLLSSSVQIDDVLLKIRKRLPWLLTSEMAVGPGPSLVQQQEEEEGEEDEAGASSASPIKKRAKDAMKKAGSSGNVDNSKMNNVLKVSATLKEISEIQKAIRDVYKVASSQRIAETVTFFNRMYEKSRTLVEQLVRTLETCLDRSTSGGGQGQGQGEGSGEDMMMMI
jgi:hypothetical protein